MSKNVDLDFYLRQALARYQAKNNRLIEKWRKRLNSFDSAQFGLISVVSEFLEDLTMPLEDIISDFDWKDCK